MNTALFDPRLFALFVEPTQIQFYTSYRKVICSVSQSATCSYVTHVKLEMEPGFLAQATAIKPLPVNRSMALAKMYGKTAITINGQPPVRHIQ